VEVQVPGSALNPPGAMAPFVFGKLPAHGDFISRGLTDDIVEAADSLIAQAIALGMIHWDAAWDDVYVETPVWRFMATPGVLGPAWTAGILIASVDAVGRQYPLVAGVECATLSLLARPASTTAMLDEMELTVRDALLNGLTVDAVQDRLGGDRNPVAREEPEAAFSALMLGEMEANPASMQSVWWVAGGGSRYRSNHKGPLVAEFLSTLFRRSDPIDAQPSDVQPSSVIISDETIPGERPEITSERDSDPVLVVSSPETEVATDVPRPT
jgi:type VI secretion system ImpM family protein